MKDETAGIADQEKNDAAVELLKELRNEKWRYRLLMAIWLIVPNFKKQEAPCTHK